MKWSKGDIIQNRWKIHDIKGGPGKSGMGIVYIVYDHKTRQSLAMKTVQDKFLGDEGIMTRFVNEALTWIKLERHKHIVSALTVEKVQLIPFILLEYISGSTLRSWIGTPRLNIPQALRFAVQFCLGMKYANGKLDSAGRKVLQAHRDIKPENIMITADKILKITDFGLAKVLDESRILPTTSGAERLRSLGIHLTRTGKGAGTPAYMAPEQWIDVKTADIRSDIYSFGIVLYEMLTGELPFEASTISELCKKHLEEEPTAISELVPNLPKGLNNVVMRCLEKEPQRQFANFTELRIPLVEILHQLTGETISSQISQSEIDARYWYNNGVALENLGLYEEAIASHEQALQNDPGYYMAWCGKGYSLMNLKKYEEAITCYENAIQLEPQNALAWCSKGSCLSHLGRHQEAIPFCDQSIQIDSTDTKAWLIKSQVLTELKRYEEAIVCADKALQFDPGDIFLWLQKGVIFLYFLNKWDDAIHCFKQMLKINPGMWEVKKGLLMALQRKGNDLNNLRHYDEALACYDEMIEISEKDISAWINKGIALDNLGRHREAITCYNKVLEIDPTDANDWVNKSVALGKMTQYQQAVNCYDKAIEINPTFAEAWYNKGMELVNLGMYQKALHCFRQAQHLGLSSAEEEAEVLEDILQLYGLGTRKDQDETGDERFERR